LKRIKKELKILKLECAVATKNIPMIISFLDLEYEV